MNIQEIHSYSLCFENFCRLNRLPDKVSGGNYGDIGSLIEMQCFSDFENLLFGSKVGYSRASEPQINGTLPGCCCDGGRFGLVVVARIDYYHIGEHPHKSDILEDLVRSPIFAESDTGVGCGYFDVGFRVANRLSDLIIYPACGKICKCARKGNIAADCKSCRHSYHICLGDATLEKSFRMSFCKSTHLYRARQICAERNYFGVGSTEMRKTRSKTRTGILISCIDIFFHSINF